MTAHDIQTYRQRLWETASRLAGEVTSLRAEALRPTGSGTDERADPGAQAADESLALTLLGTEAGSLAEVNAALDRIERGTFGRCEACGHPVGRARLNVLPHARFCIECARRAEAGGVA